MAVLIIDGHNFMHRARSGFAKGEHSVVFNTFRNLRALIEMHSPSRVIFVLEGHPQFRYDQHAGYKANRVVDEGSEAHEVLKDFFRQKDIIVDLMSKHFPVSVVRHEDFECDDVVYNIIHGSARSTEFIVASNDSDFTQLLDEFDNVRVYNPMKKCFVESPEHDYVTWKSLRGDASDCIPGIPGIGDKRAAKLAEDPDALREWLEADVERTNIFLRNMNLIKFHAWDSEELKKMTSSEPSRDWGAVKVKFTEWRFNSMVKEPYWTKKFLATFDTLWEVK